MRFAIVALLVFGACKSRGTITLNFDLTGGCSHFAGDVHYTLYAEPGISCDVCACGACAGADPNQVIACPAPDHPAPCTDLHDLSLDLSPGVWAVVVQAHANGTGSGAPSLDAGAGEPVLASQCIDVIVDKDGTGTSSLGSGSDANHCRACPLP